MVLLPVKRLLHKWISVQFCAGDYLVRRYFIATLERSFVGHTHTRGVLARSVTIYLRCSRAMRTECILRPCGSF